MSKEQVCANILGVLKPGDVINQVAHPKWWQFWFPQSGLRGGLLLAISVFAVLVLLGIL